MVVTNGVMAVGLSSLRGNIGCLPSVIIARTRQGLRPLISRPKPAGNGSKKPSDAETGMISGEFGYNTNHLPAFRTTKFT